MKSSRIINNDVSAAKFPVLICDIASTTELNDSAKNLGAAFYRTTEEKIYISNMNTQPKVSEPGTCVVSGVLHNDLLGGYNVDEFVGLFVNHCKSNMISSLDVTDIYLVLLQQTTSTENNLKFLQSIADRLYWRGFLNIKVHANAPLELCANEICTTGILPNLPEMLDAFKIINSTRKMRGNLLDETIPAPGFIFNIKITKTNFERASHIVPKNKALSLQELVALGSCVSESAPYLPPRDYLDLPQNVFLPNESLELRRDRIKLQLRLKVSEEHAEAVKLLKSRSQYLKTKGSVFLASQLETLIQQLEQNDPAKWTETFQKFIINVEKHSISGIALQLRRTTSDKKSNTLALLNALNAKDFTKAREIMEMQSIKSVSPNRRSSFFSATHPDVDRGIPTKQQTEESRRLVALRDVILNLMAILQYENNILNRTCYSVIYTYEINTKNIKYRALENLSKCQTLDELILLSQELKKKNTRVMRSFRSNRVKDLIDEIIEPKLSTDQLRRRVLIHQTDAMQNQFSVINENSASFR